MLCKFEYVHPSVHAMCLQSIKVYTMSGPEDNENLIPKEESGTSCLDLDNTQIDVEKELKTCNYSLIGTAGKILLKSQNYLNVYEQICKPTYICMYLYVYLKDEPIYFFK